MSGNTPNDISSLLHALDSLQSTIATESNAWAHRVNTARKSYLAAVMGPAITRCCRESDDWTVADGVDSDGRLSEAIREARSAAPDLEHAIRCHIEWIMREVESGLCEEIRRPGIDPNFDPDRIDAHASAWACRR